MVSAFPLPNVSYAVPSHTACRPVTSRRWPCSIPLSGNPRKITTRKCMCQPSLTLHHLILTSPFPTSNQACTASLYNHSLKTYPRNPVSTWAWRSCFPSVKANISSILDFSNERKQNGPVQSYCHRAHPTYYNLRDPIRVSLEEEGGG